MHKKRSSTRYVYIVRVDDEEREYSSLYEVRIMMTIFCIENVALMPFVAQLPSPMKWDYEVLKFFIDFCGGTLSKKRVRCDNG